MRKTKANCLTQVILSQEAQQAGRTSQFQDTEKQPYDSIAKIPTQISEIKFL